MEQRVNDIFIAFDLEMNQPSDKIIEIGAVAGNIRTGEILDSLDIYVKINEPICVDPKICDISKLTGITDDLLKEKGVSLLEANSQLYDFCEHYKVQKTPLVWGIGDLKHLKDELVSQKEFFKFYFNRRFFDVKSFFQVYMHMNYMPMQAGLKKAFQKMNLSFEGKAHNATVDALNTFKMAHILFHKIQ